MISGQRPFGPASRLVRSSSVASAFERSSPISPISFSSSANFFPLNECPYVRVIRVPHREAETSDAAAASRLSTTFQSTFSMKAVI